MEISMDSEHRVVFETLPWTALAPGARQKACLHLGTVLRLLELSPGFVEPDWCRNGHVGYVLSGKFDIDFDGALVQYRAGDGIMIPRGDGHRHKAVVGAVAVQLVLVERV
jgi:hypothetical protein